MNGYRPFGIESSAWQNGYEAGIRKGRATALLKEHELSPEEGILHIRKIVDKYREKHSSWDIVDKMRHEGDLWNQCMVEIETILRETKTRLDG